MHLQDVINLLGIGDPLEKVQNNIGRLVANAYKVVETFWKLPK
jgi:hypothetical protein